MANHDATESNLVSTLARPGRGPMTAMSDSYSRGQSRWPSLALSCDAFERHRLRLGLDERQTAARAEDLFLVAAVLEQVPRAIAHFDQCLSVAARVAARIDRAPNFVDDVGQELRLKLLTGNTPKLWAYSGAGALVDWLRVTAMRIALNLKRCDRLQLVDDLPEAIMEDQGAVQFRGWYLADLHEALRVSFRRLTARDRTLLRLHFVDGLNIERIGSVYRVNRSTVARWLVAIRNRLFEGVKSELGAKHGLDTADVKSLYRLMERDVHLTMSRLLA
jgi:RNA polymerase sigma-70 factor (ECF subfamily)